MSHTRSRLKSGVLVLPWLEIGPFQQVCPVIWHLKKQLDGFSSLQMVLSHVGTTEKWKSETWSSPVQSACAPSLLQDQSTSVFSRVLEKISQVFTVSSPSASSRQSHKHSSDNPSPPSLSNQTQTFMWESVFVCLWECVRVCEADGRCEWRYECKDGQAN